MPCDDNKQNGNVIEFRELLNDVCILSNSTDSTHLYIMGDFNTDFSRTNAQTMSLRIFINSNDFYLSFLAQLKVLTESESSANTAFNLVNKLQNNKLLIKTF